MAIALTPFTALCGFRPLPEIADFICNTPEFAKLIPHEIASKFVALASAFTSSSPTQEDKTVLRDVFAAVMTAEDSIVKEQLAKLAERYRTPGAGPGEDKDVANLVLTLTEQFPGDIGIFCAFLLNYVKLQPGEAIFLGAGEPHAYVSGGRCLTIFTFIGTD
jgi:mannose-6-phosphate isomerase